MSFCVAIDGPAGAGKSTVAKAVAKERGLHYVDTGAMYRTMSLYMLRNGIDSRDEKAVTAVLSEVHVEVAYEDGMQLMYLNGENVTGQIRTDEIGMVTSNISRYRPVREKLVAMQQKLAEQMDVIMDGRDIGTCVLPEADVKIYLTASVAVRAKRRHKEFLEAGQDVTLEEVEKKIGTRDYQDMHRENSPLVQAEDAVYLDSSDMTLAQVVKAITDRIDEKRRA